MSSVLLRSTNFHLDPCTQRPRCYLPLLQAESGATGLPTFCPFLIIMISTEGIFRSNKRKKATCARLLLLQALPAAVPVRATNRRRERSVRNRLVVRGPRPSSLPARGLLLAQAIKTPLHPPLTCSHRPTGALPSQQTHHIFLNCDETMVSQTVRSVIAFAGEF